MSESKPFSTNLPIECEIKDLERFTINAFPLKWNYMSEEEILVRITRSDGSIEQRYLKKGDIIDAEDLLEVIKI